MKAEKLYYTALIGISIMKVQGRTKLYNTFAMIDASEVREEDEEFKNAVDYMFALEERIQTFCS